MVTTTQVHLSTEGIRMNIRILMKREGSFVKKTESNLSKIKAFRPRGVLGRIQQLKLPICARQIEIVTAPVTKRLLLTGPIYTILYPFVS